MATVRWSSRALRNLSSIRDYWSDNVSEEVAERLTTEIVEAVGRLSDFPELGRVIPELGQRDLREVLSGNYRVPYRLLDGESVYIVTVVDARQDFRTVTGVDTWSVPDA